MTIVYHTDVTHLVMPLVLLLFIWTVQYNDVAFLERIRDTRRSTGFIGYHIGGPRFVLCQSTVDATLLC